MTITAEERRRAVEELLGRAPAMNERDRELEQLEEYGLGGETGLFEGVGPTRQPIGNYFNEDTYKVNERMAQVAGPGIIGARQEAYFPEDVGRELANMPIETLIRLQEDMEVLGFEVGQPGRKDGPTRAGFADLLVEANQYGVSWSAAVPRMKRDMEMGIRIAGAQEDDLVESEVVFTPDTETIALTVKSKFREALGRDPTEAEMRMFADDLLAGYNEQADLQELQGEMVPEDSGRITKHEDVDPMSAFRNAFDARYSGTMRLMEEQEDVTENASTFEDQAETVQNIVEGG